MAPCARIISIAAALKCGKIARRRVLDQQAFVAAIVGLAHRGLHADLGGHASEHELRDCRAPSASPRRRSRRTCPCRACRRPSRPRRARIPARSRRPGSPRMRMRPIGPGSPMRSDGLPRSRLAGGQSERSGLWRLARMQDRPALGAEQRDQRGDRRHDGVDRRQVVAERLAEAALSRKSRCMSMTTSALCAGSKRKGERLGGDLDHAQWPAMWRPIVVRSAPAASVR